MTTATVNELFAQLPAAEQAAAYEKAGVTGHALVTRAFSGEPGADDALAELLELAGAER